MCATNVRDIKTGVETVYEKGCFFTCFALEVQLRAGKGEGKAYDGNIPMKSFDMICDLHYGGRRSN